MAAASSPPRTAPSRTAAGSCALWSPRRQKRRGPREGGPAGKRLRATRLRTMRLRTMRLRCRASTPPHSMSRRRAPPRQAAAPRRRLRMGRRAARRRPHERSASRPRTRTSPCGPGPWPTASQTWRVPMASSRSWPACASKAALGAARTWGVDAPGLLFVVCRGGSPARHDGLLSPSQPQLGCRPRVLRRHLGAELAYDTRGLAKGTRHSSRDRM
mmetsp:Transcript_50465/g.141875  ORF Transcript_50465/g.141875 Transcript_50465/m.141875 type:complete len:215 (+) Transcript_50465:302-946(+)